MKYRRLRRQPTFPARQLYYELSASTFWQRQAHLLPRAVSTCRVCWMRSLETFSLCRINPWWSIADPLPLLRVTLLPLTCQVYHQLNVGSAMLTAQACLVQR